MFSHGFRARSQPGHHIAIIDFVRSRIDKKNAGLLIVFDRLRRKRNTALYDDTGFVSRHDAEQALESAVDYFLKGDDSGYFRADEIVQQRETPS